MHFCNSKVLKENCPSCKTKHEIEFKDEFNGHIHYLIGQCPECQYKIFIRNKKLTSGIKIHNRFSDLEKKISGNTNINVLLCE